MKHLPHQIEALQRIVDTSGIHALQHKTGTGKTFTGLSAYKYYKDQSPGLRLIVLCPLTLIEGAWIKEIQKLERENGWFFSWKNMNNGDVSFFSGLKMIPDILLVNYEHLMSEKNFNALVKELSMGTWMAIVDESSKIKNHQAKTTERLNGWWAPDPNDTAKKPKNIFHPGIRNFCKYRITGSATPAPNTEWEYWPQMYFLDPNILGDNFYAFKNKCFELKRGKQIAPGSFMNKAQLRELQRTGFKYEVIPDAWNKCLERMKPYVHVVDSLAGMPDEIDEFTIIEMGEQQRKIYNQMKRDYVAEIKREIEGRDVTDYAVANVALTKFMKLRQITSGFVIDEKENPIGFLKTNPKVEALCDRIEQYGQDQTIIWCQFHWEIEYLSGIIKEIGGGCSFLHGGIKPNDRINHINDFESGATRFLIAHPASAQYGLTFINCHYEDFFSLSYSHEEYVQCRGRTARHGQKFPCVYNHILCKGTIDEDMYNIVTGKITAAEVTERYLKGY